MRTLFTIRGQFTVVIAADTLAEAIDRVDEVTLRDAADHMECIDEEPLDDAKPYKQWRR